MDRRKFLESACLTTAALIVGNPLRAISSVKAKPRISLGGDVHEIPLKLEDTPDLQKVGGAYHLEIDDLEKDLLVARVSRERYVAVDIKCTHKGCDVAYSGDDKKFVCPCHSSEFDLHGAVMKGPAAKPLKSYKCELREDELIVIVTPEGLPPATDTIASPSNGDSVKPALDSLKLPK